jgi:hypothetical protein
MDKVLSRSFSWGLTGALQASFGGNPNGWYVSLMERLVIPHIRIFAVTIQVGELLVAGGFLGGAALWVWGDRVYPRGVLARAGGGWGFARQRVHRGKRLLPLRRDVPLAGSERSVR